MVRNVGPPGAQVPQNVRYGPADGGAGRARSSRPGRGVNGDRTASVYMERLGISYKIGGSD